MRLRVLAPALVLVLPAAGRAQGRNPTQLWSVPLQWTGDRLTVGRPVQLTHGEGSSSQPSFTPDGRAVVFSATRDTGAEARSDIYRIELATGVETRITRTPENENSPTVNERGEYDAVRWQPATLFKEFGPWVYGPDGTPKRGVLRGPDSTGYYTPLPDGAYVLMRPKTTRTIALFDPRSGAIVDVDSGVPALPAQRIPGANAVSYVRLDPATGHHTIRRLDLATRAVSAVAPTIVGRTVHAWVPGRNTMLMAKGNALYAWRVGRDTAWRAVATFDEPGLRQADAYVVSPRGDRLVLRSPTRPSLAGAMTDSLDAGRSGAEVAALVLTWRDAGRLATYDVGEGDVLAVGDERVRRGRAADAVAIQSLATALFPQSYRALARLGDAERAAGDSAAATSSYRRALAANPRATDADRAAAAAVERKLGTTP
jgi:hypothetical protein